MRKSVSYTTDYIDIFSSVSFDDAYGAHHADFIIEGAHRAVEPEQFAKPAAIDAKPLDEGIFGCIFEMRGQEDRGPSMVSRILDLIAELDNVLGSHFRIGEACQRGKNFALAGHSFLSCAWRGLSTWWFRRARSHGFGLLMGDGIRQPAEAAA